MAYFRSDQQPLVGTIEQDHNASIIHREFAHTYDTPWLITSKRHSEIEKTYQSKLSCFFGFLSEFEPIKADIRGNVAILPVSGVITEKDSLFTRLMGGTSIELLNNMIDDALENDEIDTILLNIDSPGGTVAGVAEFADRIFSLKEQGIKTVSVINSEACSAACWIGAAADEYIMGSVAGITGSIGVVIKHIDISGAEEKEGIKTTEITAGPLKRIASFHKPLSEEGRATLQGQVDHIHSIFKASLTKFGVPNIENIATGGIFIGQQALDNGLVHKIENFESVLDRLQKKEVETVADTPKNQTIDLDFLQANHSALVENIRAEGFKAGLEEGTKKERKRIADITANQEEGLEAIAHKAIECGDTLEVYAVSLMQERKKRGPHANLNNIKADSQPVRSSASTGDATEAEEAEKKEIIEAMKKAYSIEIMKGD